MIDLRKLSSHICWEGWKTRDEYYGWSGPFTVTMAEELDARGKAGGKGWYQNLVLGRTQLLQARSERSFVEYLVCKELEKAHAKLIKMVKRELTPEQKRDWRYLEPPYGWYGLSLPQIARQLYPLLKKDVH